ncbi:hypothetical protein [uncultured Thiohalocapsa sp.]|uniref:tyrosine-protein kinase family protein n=1 Tax=uncultured Thiohalocapsa sp. TaxID=768990 RepID=UPI0025E9E406|nr:hypothetical protein [uncultured Thiohalocapsa sp.]
MSSESRRDIQARIQASLEAAGIADADIRVQPDPFGGWHIAVIADGFAGMAAPERRKRVLAELQGIDIEWLDLLTPDETRWAGDLPANLDLEDLPLWPESLARGAMGVDDVLFASDLDQDLPLPLVVSFYSLRGGVGRSTALAYTARILAAEGRKVVCVDMDLEAPGLAVLFGLGDEAGEPGVVDLLLRLDQGETPDFSRYLIPVDETLDLYCLPAGRGDADYARRLRFIDPAAWYREARNPLRELLTGLAERLPFRPDVILLDARTGFNPLNAPLLFDLADLAVVTFFPHPQARLGTEGLVRALLASRTVREVGGRHLTPDIRFLVSPIPATKVPEVVQRYKHRALEWIADWIAPANRQRDGAPLLEEDITQFVPYRESLASADRILNDRESWRDFEPVAQWISRFIPSSFEERGAVPIKDRKARILGELRFGVGTAEQQDDFLATFVETDMVRKALSPAAALVLGRKGAGKTALFRRLAEDAQMPGVVVQAPAAFRRDYPWLLGPEGFAQVDAVLADKAVPWGRFWAFYLCRALTLSAAPRYDALIPAPLVPMLSGPPSSELELVERFEASLDVARSSLLLGDFLLKANRETASPTFVLFDGLDSGFDSSAGGRQIRERALNGLFAFWMDKEAALDRLRFKILLREDIWRKLRFENKSHLFGRAVSLAWKEPIPFFKVVLKQALRSPGYRALVEASLSGLAAGGLRLDGDRLDGLSDEQVLAAWNLLVGERMKGGKTAFTRNWVWNRLADGNDDHSPRHLLQLFHTVTAWEQAEMDKTEYDKSLIRPRALAACLPEVSEQALDAIEEEFRDELGGLVVRLREIGRTPFPADDLDAGADAVALGREIGLLAVYEGSEESVERYTVPEIYRHALGMTRKGQV